MSLYPAHSLIRHQITPATGTTSMDFQAQDIYNIVFGLFSAIAAIIAIAFAARGYARWVIGIQSHLISE